MNILIKGFKGIVVALVLIIGVSMVLTAPVVHAQEWTDGCGLCDSNTGWSDTSYTDSYTPAADATGWSDTSYTDSYTPAADATGWSDTSYNDSYTPVTGWSDTSYNDSYAPVTGWSDTSYKDSYTPVTGWSDTSYKDSYTPNSSNSNTQNRNQGSSNSGNNSNYNPRVWGTSNSGGYSTGGGYNYSNNSGYNYNNGSYNNTNSQGPSCSISSDNTANLGVLNIRESVSVRWSSTGATSANLIVNGSNVGAVSVSGSRTLYISTDSTFSLTVRGPGGTYTCEAHSIYIPTFTAQTSVGGTPWNFYNNNVNTNYTPSTPFYNYNYNNNYNQVSAPIYRAQPQHTVAYSYNDDRSPSISLSQIPYTGLADSAWYWGAIVAFAGALMYLLAITKKSALSFRLPRYTARLLVIAFITMSAVLTPTTKTHAQVYQPTTYNTYGTGIQSQLSCSINTNTSAIDSGNAATLSWQSVGATYATLSDNVGSVSVNGTLSVRPDKSRTYTLTVYGLYGQSATCSSVVYVNQIVRNTPATVAPVYTNTNYNNYSAGYNNQNYVQSNAVGPTYNTGNYVVSYGSGSNLRLSRLPYTGVGDTATYWAAIIAFAGALLYLLQYRRVSLFA